MNEVEGGSSEGTMKREDVLANKITTTTTTMMAIRAPVGSAKDELEPEAPAALSAAVPGLDAEPGSPGGEEASEPYAVAWLGADDEVGLLEVGSVEDEAREEVLDGADDGEADVSKRSGDEVCVNWGAIKVV